jgi:nitronate monooxygenase
LIETRLTRMFGLQYPIVLAPMGGVSGGRLAAAVSNAGGLGLVGGGYGDAAWLRHELARVKKETAQPWGVGFITWSVDRSLVELALQYQPHALMLSFGDPKPYADLVRSSGCKLICQVQDLQGACIAQEAGADLIVAQGSEAGGHGASRATLPLVPAVVDAVAPTPVLAAGGIADGRGLAAALMLGAQGALIGTRFYASVEALGPDLAKQRIVQARGDQTARTRVFDIVRKLGWPQANTGRALRNRFLERWDGRESELAAALGEEQAAYSSAARDADFDTAVVWAGEAVDLIKDVERAATLVARIGAEASVQLSSGFRMVMGGTGTPARAASSNAQQTS